MKIMKQDGGAEWFWELNLKRGGGGIVQKIRWADFLLSILQIWGTEARQEGFN